MCLFFAHIFFSGVLNPMIPMEASFPHGLGPLLSSAGLAGMIPPGTEQARNLTAFVRFLNEQGWQLAPKSDLGLSFK